MMAGSCSVVLPQQDQYEEETYLALDGSATVYVNSSVAALVALRGLPLDVQARAIVDRAAVRAAYTSPVTEVTRVSTSRRNGRRFVHLRLAVSDVRALARSRALRLVDLRSPRSGAMSTSTRRSSAAAAGVRVGDVGWKGEEVVAFRMHLPSKIRYHNAPSKQVDRGNILAWEQPLADRLTGKPVAIEVRLDTQSILYRTLWLFGLMMVLVAALFAGVIWWVVRAGRRSASAGSG